MKYRQPLAQHNTFNNTIIDKYRAILVTIYRPYVYIAKVFKRFVFMFYHENVTAQADLNCLISR